MSDLSASVTRVFALLKRIAAISNYKLGLLSQDVASHIIMATKELVQDRETLRQFVGLSLTNLTAAHNVLNSRLTKHATKIAKVQGQRKILVVEADVNLNQSPQNWFFSAIQILLTLELRGTVLPKIERLCEAARQRARGIDEAEATSTEDSSSLSDLGAWAGQLAYASSNLVVAVSAFATLDMMGGDSADSRKDSDAMNDFNSSCIIRLIGSTCSDFNVSPKCLSPAERNDLFFKMSIALCTYTNVLTQMIDRLRWLLNAEFARKVSVSDPTSPERKLLELKHAGSCRDFDAATSCCIQILANDAAIAIIGKRGNLEEAFSLFSMTNYLLKSIDKLVDVHVGIEKYLLSNDAGAGFGSAQLEYRPNFQHGGGACSGRTKIAQ